MAKSRFEILGTPPATEKYIVWKNTNKGKSRNGIIRSRWTYARSFDIFQESSEANVFALGDTCR